VLALEADRHILPHVPLHLYRGNMVFKLNNLFTIIPVFLFELPAVVVSTLEMVLEALFGFVGELWVAITIINFDKFVHWINKKHIICSWVSIFL